MRLVTAADPTGSVLLCRDGDVAEIVLNRPDRRNALSGKAIVDLTDAVRRVAEADVGAVVLRGADGFFCSGLDRDELGATVPPLDAWIAVHRALADLDAPVVACLLGGAINAGAALVLAADLVVAGETAYLQIMEASIGMVPTVNAAWLALRYPASVGLQLTLPGRRTSAPELHRLGVVAQLCPDGAALEQARALAGRLAGFPARSAAHTKRVLRTAAEHRGDFTSAVAAALDAGGNAVPSSTGGGTAAGGAP